MRHLLAMRLCRSTLLLVLACLACWSPQLAASQGLLVFDDTLASNPTEEAATRLALPITTTRNVASFVLQADSGTAWDAIVLDISRLALTPAAENAIAAHVASGGTLIVATDALATLGGLQAVVGVECRANTGGTAIYDTSDPEGASLFDGGDSLPSPLRLVNSPRADCAPESADVFARFGTAPDSPPAIYRLPSGTMMLGVSLARIDDRLDADADGVGDSVELMTNVLELTLAARRAGVAALVDGDVSGAQQWAEALGVSITFYETLQELVDSDTSFITGVVISTDALDSEPLDALDALADEAVPVLVFSDGWAAASDWQTRWGFLLGDEPATGVLSNSGGGLGAQLLGAAPLLDGLAAAPSSTLLVDAPWYPLAARDGAPVVALDIENHRAISSLPLSAADTEAQALLLAALYPLAANASRTVSIVSSSPELWVDVVNQTGRFPVVIAPDAPAIGDAVADGPVDAVIYDLSPTDMPTTGVEAELLQRARDGEFGLVVQQQGSHTAWPDALGVSVGDELREDISVLRRGDQLTGVFKLPQATPSLLTLRGGVRPITDPGDHVVIASAGDDAVIVGDLSARLIFSVAPTFSVLEIDSDRDQRVDNAELAAGLLQAVLIPQRALVAGDDPLGLLQAAAEATGLVVDVASADAPELSSDAYSYVLWQGSGDDALTPELTGAVLERVAAARPTVLFVTDADNAPAFSAALDLTATDPLTAGPLVEPFDAPLAIFREPRFVPSPLSVVAPVDGDPGDQFSDEDPARSLAAYNVNVGPAATVLSEDSSWLINGWDPSLRGDVDFDFDGVPDVSELIANELLIVSRAPVARVVGPSAVVEGARFLLDASTSFDRNDSSLTFEWDLNGDSLFDDDTGPVVLFDARSVDGPARASATLRVTNELGIRGFGVFSFDVANAAPRIVNSGTRRVEEGRAAMLSVDVLDVPADELSVRWVFDDGVEAEGATIVREFDELGVYEAVVTAIDDDGGEDTAIVRVEYVNAAPEIVLAELPPEVAEGTSIELSAIATDNTDTPTVRWRFGDGAEAEGAMVTHAYRDEGSYTILATATDALGAVSSTSVRLSVTNAAPAIVSEAPRTVDGSNEYRYEVRVEDPGDDVIRYGFALRPDGMQISEDGVITWAPSLGALSDAAVVLQVNDGDGGEAQQSWTITVAAEDSDGGGAPDVCELRFGADIDDPSDDTSDEDGDGLTLAVECIAGSDPTAFSGPGVPTPVTPNNTIVEFRFNTVLTFENTTDPEGDALSYQVELSRDELMQELTFSATNVSPTGRVQTRVAVPGTLEEDRRYYWRVRAVTADVVGEWSDVVSFRVNRTNRPPGRATLVTPLAFSDTRRPTLIWRNPSDPDGDSFTYEMELYDRSLDDTRVWALSDLEPQERETSATLSFALEDEGRYVWRVRAVDSSPPFPRRAVERRRRVHGRHREPGPGQAGAGRSD